eukprot:SAG31_NODE_27653_length_422_cov_1.120743_2_plen_26_part_01
MVFIGAQSVLDLFLSVGIYTLMEKPL